MILLSKSIIDVESSYCRIIMPCPIIIPVQPFLRIQFLAILFVGLDINTCKDTSERIVMVGFLYCSRLIYNHPVISLMILQVVVILLSARQVHISFFSKQKLLSSIFIDHISAVIRSSGITAYLMNSTEFRSVSR